MSVTSQRLGWGRGRRSEEGGEGGRGAALPHARLVRCLVRGERLLEAARLLWARGAALWLLAEGLAQ